MVSKSSAKNGLVLCVLGCGSAGAFVVEPTFGRPLPASTIWTQQASRFQPGACTSRRQTRIMVAGDNDGDEAAAPSPAVGKALSAAVAATVVASAAGAAATFGELRSAGLGDAPMLLLVCPLVWVEEWSGDACRLSNAAMPSEPRQQRGWRTQTHTPAYHGSSVVRMMTLPRQICSRGSFWCLSFFHTRKASPRSRLKNTQNLKFALFCFIFAGAGFEVPLAVSQLMADPVACLAANPEWTRYAFMFPVGVLVATCAQTAGIGGAAIMGPFFLLGFPLLGPGYPLHSVAASVATAILSEAFGFSSGERQEKCTNLPIGLVWFGLV